MGVSIDHILIELFHFQDFATKVGSMLMGRAASEVSDQFADLDPVELEEQIRKVCQSLERLHVQYERNFGSRSIQENSEAHQEHKR